MDRFTRIRLPKLVARRTYWKYMVAFVLATVGVTAGMVVLGKKVPSNFALYALSVGLGLGAVALYVGQQVWIAMDRTGFNVQTTYGWSRFHVDWSAEIVWERRIMQLHLSGVSFTETRTGLTFFLPDSVINSLEFANALQIYAPKKHVFLHLVGTG